MMTEKTPRPNGRRSLPEHLRRERRLGFAANVSEELALEAGAMSEGKSLGEYLRTVALAHARETA